MARALNNLAAGRVELWRNSEAQTFRGDAHSGRVVKLMGDGALVEFASAVEAAWLRNSLDPCRDIDAVAKDVVAMRQLTVAK